MKRLVIVASFGLLALLAACTTDDGSIVGPTPVPTTRPPSRGTSSSSSSSSSTGGIPTDPPPDVDDFCPMDVPLTVSDLDEEIGWKPGAPAQGSCTATDLQKIEANFKSTSVKTYFDLGTGISDPCFACVFSKDTDAKWGPIVGTAENDGETGFVNYGACFGAIEGDACGKAIQYEDFCGNVACNECSVTTTERAQCVAKANAGGGMCESFVNTKTKACPSWTLNVKSCGEIQTAIKTLCGTPS